MSDRVDTKELRALPWTEHVADMINDACDEIDRLRRVAEAAEGLVAFMGAVAADRGVGQGRADR